MISVGEDREQVTMACIRIGEDLLVIITGGDEHIGSVSLSDVSGCSTLVKKGHRESLITELIAQRIQKFFKQDVLVVCGIHIDNANAREISVLLENTKRCVDIFLKE